MKEGRVVVGVHTDDEDEANKAERVFEIKTNWQYGPNPCGALGRLDCNILIGNTTVACAGGGDEE